MATDEELLGVKGIGRWTMVSEPVVWVEPSEIPEAFARPQDAWQEFAAQIEALREAVAEVCPIVEEFVAELRALQMEVRDRAYVRLRWWLPSHLAWWAAQRIPFAWAWRLGYWGGGL